MKRKKTPKAIPSLSTGEVGKQFAKTEAILLRMTAADKNAINRAASALHVTTTELCVKAALMVAAKLPKVLAFAILLGAGCVLASFRAGASDISPPATGVPNLAGSWSQVVDGIRGRLVIEYPGNKSVRVYLELEAVRLDPRVYARTSKGTWYAEMDSLKLELTDSRGNAVPRDPRVVLSYLSMPFWIAIPPESTLRFFLGQGGCSNAVDAGLDFGLLSNCWRIARGGSETYYLSATFKGQNPPKDGSPHVNSSIWIGELAMPKVALTVPSE